MFIYFLTCCAGGALGTHPATDPEHELMEFTDSPYLAIANGAKVYAGTVTLKHASADSSDDIEVGKLDFRVQAVLQGSPESSISLPYSFRRRPSRAGPTSEWTSVDDLLNHKTLLLIVVMPGATDQFVHDADGTVGAVCNLHPISGDDDPLVAAYRRMLSTDKLKGSELDSMLATEAASTVYIERQFAEEAAYNRLDADGAIKVIDVSLATGSKDKANPPDLSSGVELEFDISTDPSRTDGERLSAQRSLAKQAGSDNAYLGNIALQYLASVVNKGPKPSDLLTTPADREALLRSATIAARNPNNDSLRTAAKAVLNWLNAG
jgi:hypothetical protein